MSLGSLCQLVGSRVRKVWPGGNPPRRTPGDLTGLWRLLGECNAALGSEGRRLILAFDDTSTSTARSARRCSRRTCWRWCGSRSRSHRNLTWVFAGSHEIEELTAAEWPSYLVSARTIEVPLFTEAETRLLLTEPLKHSTLWPKDRERPQFRAGVLGRGGHRAHPCRGGRVAAPGATDRGDDGGPAQRSGQRQVDDAAEGAGPRCGDREGAQRALPVAARRVPAAG